MSQIDDLPPLRDVVRTHGLLAKKSLGQNFLFDLNLTSRIARSAGPLEDTTVIEVGPGPGGLTRAILAAGARKVIAIERDARCLPALAEIAAHYPGRLEVVEADALTFDPLPLVGNDPVRIISNLPYNVGTALLTGWLATPRLAAVVAFADADVPARSGRADRGGRERPQGLRPPRRPLRLADGGAHPLRRAALGLRAAAEDHLERRPPDASRTRPFPAGSAPSKRSRARRSDSGARCCARA